MTATSVSHNQFARCTLPAMVSMQGSQHAVHVRPLTVLAFYTVFCMIYNKQQAVEFPVWIN